MDGVKEVTKDDTRVDIKPPNTSFQLGGPPDWFQGFFLKRVGLERNVERLFFGATLSLLLVLLLSKKTEVREAQPINTECGLNVLVYSYILIEFPYIGLWNDKLCITKGNTYEIYINFLGNGHYSGGPSGKHPTQSGKFSTNKGLNHIVDCCYAYRQSENTLISNAALVSSLLVFLLVGLLGLSNLIKYLINRTWSLLSFLETFLTFVLLACVLLIFVGLL